MADLRAMNSPTLTSLNEDILLHLSYMLTSKTLLALMSTCRDMFRTGLPTLLARPRRSFYNKTLSTFHDFLTFFAPTSFLSLRDLRFSGNRTPAELDIILDILQRAVNLCSLEISICDALEGQEDIVEAVTRLSKLENLIFTHEATDVCHPILERLQAPLAYLTLQVDDNGEPQLPLLFNFQDTLEHVYLQYSELTEISFSCHKLTQLFLHYCWYPRLSVLINAFPNLEVLSYNSGYHSTPFGLPEHDELRRNNIAFQAHKQWSSLTSLTVDELGMYMLGLQTEVDSVILPSQLSYRDDEDWSWLNMSLQSLRPRHLRLTCSGETSGLPQALGLGMERLDRLDLEVYIRDDSISEDVTVSFILHTLALPHSVPCLHLKDGLYSVLGSTHALMLSCEIEVNCGRPELLEYLRSNFDPTKIAEGAMSAGPTLAFIKIKVVIRYGSQAESYWVVNKNGDERYLQQVHSPLEVSRINRLFLPAQVQNKSFHHSLEYWEL
ncbi:hypothetical protein EIP86_001980 [Pleurotus ostreatoroseus]|nr:hypothetical protein EIP86_001980 [Pleurotus ostreatoroseus]